MSRGVPQGNDQLDRLRTRRRKLAGFHFSDHQVCRHRISAKRGGDLGWYPLDTLEKLPMWEGDRFFLPLVFDADPRIFYGYMPYMDGRPVDWTYRRI